MTACKSAYQFTWNPSQISNTQGSEYNKKNQKGSLVFREIE